MSMIVKKRLEVMFSALIAFALIVVCAPAVSYAQSLAIKAKIQTTEKLVDENIADALKNERNLKTGKTSIRNKLFIMAKPKVEKRIKDEAASNKQSSATEIADAIMKEILPQMDKLVAEEIAKEESKAATTDKSATGQPNIPKTSFFDWTVNNTETWIEAVNGIKKNGNWKVHTINVSGDISIPINSGYTFGSVKKVTVNLDGDGKLSLSGDGNLLKVGAGQTVSVMGTLKLSGRDKNTGSMIVVDSGGTLRMAGNAAIMGNIMNGDGGGVLVRFGDFIMDENSS